VFQRRSWLSPARRLTAGAPGAECDHSWRPDVTSVPVWRFRRQRRECLAPVAVIGVGFGVAQWHHRVARPATHVNGWTAPPGVVCSSHLDSTTSKSVPARMVARSSAE
jgi:hypothetical protein